MSLETSDNSLDPIFLQNQLRLARNEINNLRQQLSTLNYIHRKECDLIYKKLEEWQCVNCKRNQASQEVPMPSSSNFNPYDFHSNYIGTINTLFPEKRGTPRQPGICGNMIAKLTLDNNVFTNPEHALQGLEEFSHMWILFHFHKNESTHIKAKVAPPRLNGVRTGILATRSPHRPCPIGLSLVKIDRIMDNTIYFSGVDMVNGTPVLDIKPYIPQYDYPGVANLHHPESNDCTDSLVDSAGDLSLNNGGTNTSISDSVYRLDNIAARVMDGEENGHRDNAMGSSVIESNRSQTEETFHNRSNSRIGEREAPDGEEEESSNRTVPQVVQSSNATTPVGHIRVPSWIGQPLVSRLTVLFKDRALSQLAQLGPEGEEKKIAITNVLKEDPRSVYLRERWSSHCYVFRIAELYVSCKFNDTTHSVTVYQVFQNEVSTEIDE